MIKNRGFFPSLDQQQLLSITRSRLPTHTIGYATTIHKSQGSEFQNILIVLPSPDDQLLTRELLYVAVSRAKMGVIIVGDQDSLLNAINNNESNRSGIFSLL